MPMRAITIPYLAGVDSHTTVDGLLAEIGPLVATELGEVPWAAFPYHPMVCFKIAHTAVGILLLYEVQEKQVKATYHQANDPVYKDSCVEFFLSFDGLNYYNLEFNSIGTGLIGFGPMQKSGRKRLSREMVEQVKTYSHIAPKTTKSGDTQWRLLLHIPLTLFGGHVADGLAGMRCTGNFYKCGDDLRDPHYIAWAPIDYPIPNFHLPQCFGELVFQ